MTDYHADPMRVILHGLQDTVGDLIAEAIVKYGGESYVERGWHKRSPLFDGQRVFAEAMERIARGQRIEWAVFCVVQDYGERVVERYGDEFRMLPF